MRDYAGKNAEALPEKYSKMESTSNIQQLGMLHGSGERKTYCNVKISKGVGRLDSRLLFFSWLRPGLFSPMSTVVPVTPCTYSHLFSIFLDLFVVFNWIWFFFFRLSRFLYLSQFLLSLVTPVTPFAFSHILRIHVNSCCLHGLFWKSPQFYQFLSSIFCFLKSH